MTTRAVMSSLFIALVIAPCMAYAPKAHAADARLAKLPPALSKRPLPGLGRPLSGAEAIKAGKYLELLIKWQKSHRLLGSTNPQWLIDNVLLDSLCFLAAVPPEARKIIDVGSGAGVPGIPIAIVRPEVAFTLVEPRRRRVSFLATAIRELELRNTEVVESRVEALIGTHAGQFDVAVMRCTGDLDDLLPAVFPLLAAKGVVVASGRPDEAGPEGSVITVDLGGGAHRRLRRRVRP